MEPQYLRLSIVLILCWKLSASNHLLLKKVWGIKSQALLVTIGKESYSAPSMQHVPNIKLYCSIIVNCERSSVVSPSEPAEIFVNSIMKTTLKRALH